MDAEEEVELAEGMPVATEDGEPLGKLAGLLVGEDEEEAEFLLLTANGADRLIPFDAVLGVGDGSLILDVPAGVVEKFPRMRQDAEPTDDEIDLAYRVYEENAAYESDE